LKGTTGRRIVRGILGYFAGGNRAALWRKPRFAGPLLAQRRDLQFESGFVFCQHFKPKPWKLNT
jgi:hypothetical protein